MIDNVFATYVIENEIYVNEECWSDLKLKYSEEFLIQQLSDAIVYFKISLPYRKIHQTEMWDDFKALQKLDTSVLIKNGAWTTKFPYKWKNLDTYIDLSNVGAKASDYFHQIERWKCDATGYPSPQKTWETEKFRLTLLKAIFSLKLKEINPDKLRNCIALRKYIASQFRPSAAKAVYDYFKAESVLDFSMGWGDRLTGAFASNYVKRYFGFDPNKNLSIGYEKQYLKYSSIGAQLIYSYLPKCAEDKTIKIEEKFDLIFTSPPYFDKEKYDQSENQSYVKYKKFDDWMRYFLFQTIVLRTEHLKVGGHLVINISDIYTRKKHYEICDPMNDLISAIDGMEYVGAIGFRMPKRPQSMSSESVGIYCEPMYVWRKIK